MWCGTGGIRPCRVAGVGGLCDGLPGGVVVGEGEDAVAAAEHVEDAPVHHLMCVGRGERGGWRGGRGGGREKVWGLGATVVCVI